MGMFSHESKHNNGQVVSKDNVVAFCRDKLNTELDHKELEAIINIADEYELIEIQTKAFIKQGDLFYSENKYVDAYRNYLYALDLVEYENEYSRKAYICNRIGSCKFCTFGYDEAMQYYSMAANNARLINDNDTLMRSFFNIALCYKRIDRLDDAITYMEMSIERNEDKENFVYYVDANMFRVECYYLKGDMDSAIHICQEVMKFSRTINKNTKENKIAMVHLYLSMGVVHKHIEMTSQSLNYYNKAERICRQYNSKYLCQVLYRKAELFKDERFHGEASIIIKEAISESIKFSDKEYMLKSYELLEQICVEMDNIERLKEVLNKENEILRHCDNVKVKVKKYNKLQGIYIKEKDYENVQRCQNAIENILENEECMYD